MTQHSFEREQRALFGNKTGLNLKLPHVSEAQLYGSHRKTAR